MSHNGSVASVRRLLLEERGIVLGKRLATYSCDNPLCVRPEHTVAMSRSAVQQRIARDMPLCDKLARNRKISDTVRGRMGKLTDEQIAEIKVAGGTEKELAAKYNVSPPTIGSIRRGEKHQHVAPNAISQMARLL